jgi:hypothetical protein
VRSADFKGEPGLKHRAVVGPNLNCHSTRISAIARAAARMLPDGIPRQISYRLACFFRSSLQVWYFHSFFVGYELVAVPHIKIAPHRLIRSSAPTASNR